jgi:hypothetical protein
MRRDLYREGSIYRIKNVRKIEGTDEKIYIKRESIYGGIIIWRFECSILYNKKEHFKIIKIIFIKYRVFRY